jgi:hypothetical protein
MQGLTAEEQARSRAGATYYEALHRRLEQRTQVHAAPSYFTRLGRLFSLARQGAYRSTIGSARFGWGDLLMDGFLAVPFGPRLRRLLPWCIAWVERVTGRSRLAADAGQGAEPSARRMERESAVKE